MRFKDFCLGLGLGALLAPAQAEDGAALAQAQGIPYPAVIAHRGASFDAPESTAPAYQLARDLGADYLEMDLQRSRDGVLVVVHDNDLRRTSDVAERFPERANSPVSAFTLAELKALDAGSWFNRAYPQRARAAFAGVRILTLDEVIDIAEGNPARTPGLYIETKMPGQFPGIEQDLQRALAKRGWLDRPGRVVLQSFDRDSLALLHQAMPEVPKVLLLWLGKAHVEPAPVPTLAESGLADKAAWYARQQPRDRGEFARWLDFARQAGAVGTGPSTALAAGGEQSYADLARPWMNRMAHDKGLLVHVYTVDEPVDFKRVSEAGVDGIFSNRPGALLKFHGRPAAQDEPTLLEAGGW